MRSIHGSIHAVYHLSSGERAAQLNLAPAYQPAPGQYLQVGEMTGPQAAHSQLLFPFGLADERHGQLLGPIPDHWIPGTRLELRGPLGKGFQLPASGLRLGLATLGSSPSRLLPLIPNALQTGSDLVLFSEPPYPELPAAVEIQPLAALPENLVWADLLLLALPVEELPNLRRQLNLEPHQRVPGRIQVLIEIPMPCAGLGECGVCAISARRGYYLACQDGPVFDLADLDW
ncbi:MAG: hypothetical protein JW862_15685 [Anaerolineales bacterium]|nr:hypothetical protein [Anaerolineales bacterium]